MRISTTTLLVVGIVIGIATLASVIAYSLSLRGGIDDVDDRVAALEEQIAGLEAAAQETRENAAEPIVVSANRSTRCGAARPLRVRVVWIIAGSQQSKCTDSVGTCAMEATVGEPLPDACR